MKLKIFLFILILAFSSGCGPGGGTGTGNPVTVRMQDNQPFAWLKKTYDAFIPSSHAAVGNIKFCFKRLRFKPDSSSAGSNYDLQIGEVSIDPNGTNLLTLKIAPGTYQRVEFDLENECDNVPGKPSVTFTNDNGTFSTQDRMTIKFDGVFVVDGTETLDLNIDALLDNLELVNNDTQIKTSLESATGDF